MYMCMHMYVGWIWPRSCGFPPPPPKHTRHSSSLHPAICGLTLLILTGERGSGVEALMEHVLPGIRVGQFVLEVVGKEVDRSAS